MNYGDREAGVQDLCGNRWYVATHKGGPSYRPGLLLQDLSLSLNLTDATRFISFFERAFDDVAVENQADASGAVSHAKVGIGDTLAPELKNSRQLKERKLSYILKPPKKDVLDAVKGLSPAQWNFKPAPERWSIAECMEHIAAEDFIRGAVENGVMKAPPAPGRDVAQIDAAIIENVPERKT